jgi:glucosamine 6-phosphate synthetase-like amidotransferase/phosphosugar isomerase protein
MLQGFGTVAAGTLLGKGTDVDQPRNLAKDVTVE